MSGIFTPSIFRTHGRKFLLRRHEVELELFGAVNGGTPSDGVSPSGIENRVDHEHRCTRGNSENLRLMRSRRRRPSLMLGVLENNSVTLL
jgi:hypothetical protein